MGERERERERMRLEITASKESYIEMYLHMYEKDTKIERCLYLCMRKTQR